MPLEFTEHGLLPPGDYSMTLEELNSSLLVVGPGADIEPDWDVDWRLHLVHLAEILADQLFQAGITEVFLDGSIVEQKAHPNDIDGYFECDLHDLATGNLQRRLNALGPHKTWTWDPRSRRAYQGYPKKQLPMWHAYRVELYPHASGVMSGIRDQYGNELTFPAAFRRQRFGNEPKGIIKIVDVIA